MSKRGRKRRDRRKHGANHGKRRPDRLFGARFVCALFTCFVCTAGGNQVRLREARVTRGARGYRTRCAPCLGCVPLDLRSYSTGQRCGHRLPIMLVPRACG